MRTATLHRATAETEVRLTLHLDGGEARIQTGLGYFDHMLMQLARHGGFGELFRQIVDEGLVRRLIRRDPDDQAASLEIVLARCRDVSARPARGRMRIVELFRLSSVFWRRDRSGRRVLFRA